MAITVVSTTPASGVTGHFIDHSIYVQFSKEIEGSYLSSDYFKIYRTNASHTAYYELVASVVTKDGVTVQVNPTGNLRPTEYYMMIVVGGTQGVKDISTDTLAANYIMYWQTAATIAPSTSGPEVIPTVVLYQDGDKSDNSNEPSFDAFSTAGDSANIALVSSFPQDKSVGVTSLSNLIFMYNDTIDTAISIPINALSGRYNDLPMDMDPFGDRSLTITGEVTSGRQAIFELSGIVDMENREYKFTLAPGVVKGTIREGYDDRTHEIKFLGPLSPVYATPDQISLRVGGWNTEIDSSVTDYDIWKLILEASILVRDVYHATMTADNMIQVNKLTICLVLKDMFSRGFILAGGIKSRTLLANTVVYDSTDWNKIITELDKCILDSIPNIGDALGTVHIGIKSGRALQNTTGSDTKNYGVYR